MEMKSLYCPHCGATLIVDDGLDTFYCQYCGARIQIQGQSDAAYEARVKVKGMAHEENMEDKKNEQEIKLKELEAEEDKRTNKLAIIALASAFAFMVIMFVLLKILV